MTEQLALYLPGILLAYSVFLVSIMSPGPNILAIMGTSMGVGRPSGLALAMGVATGSMIWATPTALGLTAVIASYAILLTAIKIAGGLFLLWLAYKAFRSAASAHDINATVSNDEGRGMMGYFLKGLTVQMTNSKAALAWIAIVSLGMQAGAPLWVAVVIVVGTTVLSVICHVLYALVFSTPPMVRVYAKGRRWVQGTLGVLFTFAGLKLLTSRAWLKASVLE
ncbi:MAG: LysE family translocator [Hyphomicrobiaceae bacterium TMED74]|nr:lysine transporter LysE [Filomicrobium sp.]RPG40309.1 MAG: LysE family translocator [Hyphomicrobiaceae bacterium TMED74]